MQRTIQVEHPGDHEASESAISKALTVALRQEGLRRTSDSYAINGYVQSSGTSSQVVLTFEAEKIPSKRASGRQGPDVAEAEEVETPSENPEN